MKTDQTGRMPLLSAHVCPAAAQMLIKFEPVHEKKVLITGELGRQCYVLKPLNNCLHTQ